MSFSSGFFDGFNYYTKLADIDRKDKLAESQLETEKLRRESYQSTIDFNVNISNFGGSEASGASVFINNELYTSLPNIVAGETFVLSVEDFLLGLGDFEISLEWAEDNYQDNNFYYAYVEPNSGVWTQFTMNTDVWANEIEWQITNEFGQVVLEEDNYSFGENTYLYELCLPEGCYTFTITDSNGDGVCAFDLNNDGLCDVGGSFSLVVGGAEMLSVSEPDEQDFGSELVFDFFQFSTDDTHDSITRRKDFQVLADFACQFLEFTGDLFDAHLGQTLQA